MLSGSADFLRTSAQMSISGASSASDRDFRLDFFRGVALFSIFIDHVASDSLLAQFTLQSLGFSDAAEVFILISGYTAGMVYGRAIERQGLLMAEANASWKSEIQASGLGELFRSLGALYVYETEAGFASSAHERA